MFDWFYGEKAMSFYKAAENQLTQINHELEILHVPHAVIETDGNIDILAISPAANSDYIEARWDLQSL